MWIVAETVTIYISYYKSISYLVANSNVPGLNPPPLATLPGASRLLVHEQHVVSGAGIGGVLAHRLPQTIFRVDGLYRLNDPPRLPWQPVDVVACLLFRVLVFGHCLLDRGSDVSRERVER